MQKYVCITKLVEHIYKETEDAFKGTTHEDSWYFYHDALSQLTAKSTVRWMKEKGYYERWLIPQLGLNSWLKYYANRSVGNRPEFMPLDNSLNADIQYALSLHCAITMYLEDDDERKFSMRTPSTIVSAIDRLWGEQGNVPSSERIMHDCDLALRAFGVVYEHGGKMVPGLANRNGHRNHAAGRNSEGWGGIRVKNLLVEEVNRWLHNHAISAKADRTETVLANLAFADDESSDEE